MSWGIDPAERTRFASGLTKWANQLIQCNLHCSKHSHRAAHKRRPKQLSPATKVVFLKGIGIARRSRASGLICEWITPCRRTTVWVSSVIKCESICMFSINTLFGRLRCTGLQEGG
jgi:hypothetical protein